MLFLSIPFDRGWRVIVDGSRADLTQANIGFSGVMLAAGEHQVELFYEVPFLRPGIFVSMKPYFLVG